MLGSEAHMAFRRRDFRKVFESLAEFGQMGKHLCGRGSLGIAAPIGANPYLSAFDSRCVGRESHQLRIHPKKRSFRPVDSPRYITLPWCGLTPRLHREAGRTASSSESDAQTPEIA